MRSDWLQGDSMGHVLAAMMPENRLVMETCIATGLRASDVLNLRTERLRQRMTVRELKTGKTRRVYFPRELYLRLVGNAGKIWVFEGRTDYTKHRTRQAVYRDVRRCAAFFKRSGVVPRGHAHGPQDGRCARDAAHGRHRSRWTAAESFGAGQGRHNAVCTGRPTDGGKAGGERRAFA